MSSFKNYLCSFKKSTTWNWKHLGSRLCSLLILKSFLVGWSWKSGIIFYCDDDGGEGDDDDVGVDDDYAADDNVDVDDDYAADDVVDVYDDYAVDDDVDGDDDDDIGRFTCRNKLPYPLQWPGWLLTLTPRPMILRWFFPFPFQYNH